MINCTFENGNQGKLRHVTVNAIIVRDNKVLLGKRGTYQGKPILQTGKWALIGGFLDRDETIEEGLRREAREESGWEIGNFKLLHIKDNPDRPEDRQNVEFVCVADALKNTDTTNEEVTKLRWFPLDDLPPLEQMAFDHGDDLLIYKNYLAGKVTLPVVGKYKDKV